MLKPRARYTERLPAALVEPRIRKAVFDVARANNVSVSEVQRAALDLFLLQYATNSSTAGTQDRIKETR